jgi:hypothetical protein
MKKIVAAIFIALAAAGWPQRFLRMPSHKGFRGEGGGIGRVKLVMASLSSYCPELKVYV